MVGVVRVVSVVGVVGEAEIVGVVVVVGVVAIVVRLGGIGKYLTLLTVTTRIILPTQVLPISLLALLILTTQTILATLPINRDKYYKL